MNATTGTFASDAERGGVHADPHAAIYDQLHHTVLQLVQAALERARSSEPADPPWPAAVPAARPQPIAPASGAQMLSAREREVLQRIAAGDSNKMAARALGLSPHTVKRHVANILGKLGARTRGQAAAWLQASH
jgi:LuxR family maltose regulon positive regulatory protein